MRSERILYEDAFSLRRISFRKFIGLCFISLLGIVLPIVFSLELIKASVFWFLSFLMFLGAVILYNPKHKRKELTLSNMFFRISFGDDEEEIPTENIAFFEMADVSDISLGKTVSSASFWWGWSVGREGVFVEENIKLFYLGEKFQYFKLRLRKHVDSDYRELYFPISNPELFFKSLLELKLHLNSKQS